MKEKPLILVVDDQKATREFMQTQVDLLGLPSLTASSGPEALALARVRKPDLILCDIVMPEMSGFDVCRQLKLDEETKNIPIVLLTCQTELAFRRESQEVQAQGFFQKPMDMLQLMEIVRKLED